MNAGRRRWITALLLIIATGLLLRCEKKPRFDYNSEQEEALEKLEWTCGTLYRISGRHATSGNRGLKTSLYPARDGRTEHCPGIAFSGFDPDWSGRSAFVFDAPNPEGHALRLEVRINDRESPDYRDRFNGTYVLAPGDNRVSIPFASLISSGSRRPLDLRKIRAVALFLVNPRERHRLYLDRFRLE